MSGSLSSLLTKANPDHLAALKTDLSANQTLQTPRSSVPTLSISSSSGKIKIYLPGKDLPLFKDEVIGEILGGYPSGGLSRSLFLKSFDSKSVSSPDCFSRDGVTPSGSNPVAETCLSCPKNVWGSGPNGKGQACKEYKMLLLNVEDHLFGQTIFELRVSGQSLKNLNNYLRQFEENQLPIWASKTRISLLKNCKYPVFEFFAQELLSAKETLLIKELLETEEIKRRLSK
jgi:hypothetical protein